MTKVSSSYFRRHIEGHFDELDLDIVCRKKRRAYAIYWADDEEPLARLRPTGPDDDVELYSWDDGRWQQAGEFGRVLPLEEALEYITDDPDDLFFEEGTSDETASETDPRLDLAIRSVGPQIFFCSMLAGAAGGTAVGPIAGLTWNLAAGLTFCLALSLLGGVQVTLLHGGRIRRRIGGLLVHVLIVGTIVAFFAAPGTVVGSSIAETMAGGFWAHATGLLIGAFATFLVLAAKLPAWLIGFSAGLLLASPLMAISESEHGFVGLAVVSLTAAATGKVYSTTTGHFRSFFLREPSQSDEQGMMPA